MGRTGGMDGMGGDGGKPAAEKAMFIGWPLKILAKKSIMLPCTWAWACIWACNMSRVAFELASEEATMALMVSALVSANLDSMRSCRSSMTARATVLREALVVPAQGAELERPSPPLHFLAPPAGPVPPGEEPSASASAAAATTEGAGYTSSFLVRLVMASGFTCGVVAEVG